MVLINVGNTVLSQEDEFEDTEHHRKVFKTHTDSTIKSIGDFISHGVATGNIRNYFMATLNEGDYHDYYANAWGGRLGYTTAEFHGFQVGVQGIFVYNVASNDITRVDPTAGKSAHYEAQLFDLENIHNRKDLDRLEELYLYYNFANSYIEVGKLNKKTPLLNPQDSRMKPYVFEGVWTDFREIKGTRLQLGYFWKASPRSLTDWYDIEDAIGLYANGYNPDGSFASYKDELKSKGILVAGSDFLISDHIKLSVWEYYLDQIMNTVFVQSDFSKNNYIAGLQYLRQDPVGNGGLYDENGHSYYDPDHRTNLFSTRIGYKLKRHLLTLNYTKILATGRFVFPREFGREQFYSTIPRMRLEGFGNTDAVAIRYRWRPRKIKNFEMKLESGLARVPDVDTYVLNKYNKASFAQGVVDLYYRPLKIWKGLSFRFLYMYRQNLDEHLHPHFVFNQSDIHHFNFITNLSF